MNAKLLFKIRQTGRNYKNKQKITYLLIDANFFLLFPCTIVYFVVVFLSILQSDAIFVLSGTKNDIAGHIVFMSPCYRPDKGTSM